MGQSDSTAVQPRLVELFVAAAGGDPDALHLEVRRHRDVAVQVEFENPKFENQEITFQVQEAMAMNDEGPV